MYFVAFCKDWCSAVPESWIDLNRRLIKWPPKNKNATAACKKRVYPKNDWPSIKFTKLLGPYLDYHTAREVEIAAVVLSTSNESPFKNNNQKNNEVLPKRLRRSTARFQQSYDEGGFCSSGDEIESIKSKISENDPQTNFNYITIDNMEVDPLKNEEFFNNSTNDSLNEQVNNTGEPFVLENHVIENTEMPLNSNQTDDKRLYFLYQNDSNDESQEQGSASSNIIQLTAELAEEKQTNNDGNQSIAPCSQDCCPGCRLKLDQMSRKLDNVLMLLNSNYKTQITPTTLLSILPPFAINNDADLEQFNELLANSEEARTQYAKLITLRRGSDGKKHVRDVLAYILTDELCCKLSWSGQKKTKMAIKDMKFIEVLTSTIINHNPRSTLTELNGAVKSWFQHASDRIKYEAKKQQVKTK